GRPERGRLRFGAADRGRRSSGPTRPESRSSGTAARTRGRGVLPALARLDPRRRRGQPLHLHIGNARVVAFDREGRHLRTFGRQGGGPGEILRSGGGIALEPDGTVSIFDFGKLGLVRFDAEGRPLDELRIDAYPAGGRFELVDGGILYQVRTFDASANTRSDALVRVSASGDSTALAHFPAPLVRPVTFASCGITLGGMPRLFAPTLVWDARGERPAVDAGAGSLGHLCAADRRVASVRRVLAPRPTTTALARRDIGEKGMRIGLPVGECFIPADEVIEERGITDVIPAIRDVAVAPDGTLWIQRRVAR